MKELKKEIENLDFGEVITYLNSGNVIFKSNIEDKGIIANNIHLMIKNKFNLDIPIFIITMPELEAILEHDPEWWGKNDKEIYNNIIFVIPSTTSKEVFETIGSPNKYEKIQEYKNNIFWSFDLKNYRKSNWWSKTARQNEDINKYDKIIIGTPIRMGMIHKKVKEFINKNVEILKNKKVAYFICCGFAENYKQYFEQNISKKLLEKAITYDTFGGEIILEKQKGFDKFIVKMVSKNIAQNKEIKILTENIDRFIEKVK